MVWEAHIVCSVSPNATRTRLSRQPRLQRMPLGVQSGAQKRGTLPQSCANNVKNLLPHFISTIMAVLRVPLIADVYNHYNGNGRGG